MVVYQHRPASAVPYAVCGFVTLYRFYSHPDKTRLRISQVRYQLATLHP